MIHTDSPEERQTRCKSINVHSGIHSGTQIFQSVCQRISQFDVGGCTCFLHMVTGNRNRIELRHIFGRVFKNIGDNLHGKLRRINVRVTHHELFQNIILNGSGQLIQRSSLFQTGNNVECQNGQHSTIHSHGYGHFVQRNLIEQNLHIQNRIHSYTGFTYVTDYTRVVGVVTAVRCQVERYRQSFLSGSQVTAIESVGLFCRRESGVLANRPGTQRIHSRIRSAQIRRNTGYIVQMFHTFQILCGIYGFYRYQFRCRPVLSDMIGFFPLRSIGGSLFRRFNIYIFKIRFHVVLLLNAQLSLISF